MLEEPRKKEERKDEDIREKLEDFQAIIGDVSSSAW